jgi:hypothetical protein
VVLVENQITTCFSVGHCQGGNSLVLLVLVYQQIQIQIGQNIAIHQHEILVALQKAFGFQ